MKLNQFMVLMAIALFAASTIAQSTINSLQSNETQQLRRYQPEFDYESYKRVYGNEEFSRIGFDKGLPISTIRGFDKLIAERYKESHPMEISISKIPLSNDVYLLAMYGNKTWFLLIKKQGERFVELSRAYNEVECQNIIPTFFIGQDRVLTVYTLVAGDGGFCGNYAFEYKNESLKAIGELNVFDIPNEDEREYGTIFGRSPFENATAEFRDNIYYITMRGKGNLYASGNDNRNARKLATRGIPITYFYDGTTWRPSGGRQISQSNYLVFSSQRDGNQEVYLLDITTGRATNLSQSEGDDGYPRCSPDGQRIAFATNRDGYWEIYLMNRDGSGQQNLTKNRGGNGYMDWSPDGQSLVFASTRNGGRNNEIYTIRANGYGLRRMTTQSAEHVYPAWSPDGRKIAFASERDGNRQIYVMNADGTNLIRLMSNRWYDDYPAWSPDSSQIAFASDRDSRSSERLDIYVANADGSDVRRIVSHPADDRHPAWSPDGSLIAFASNRDGNRDVFVVRADGTGLKKVFSSLGNDEHPHWCRKIETNTGIMISNSAAPIKLIGYIRKEHIWDGCSCTYFFKGDDTRPIYSDNFDKEIWMNIDGQDVRLNRISSVSTPKGEAIRGQRTTSIYAAPNIKVTVDIVIGKDYGEGSDHVGTITVIKGDREQTVQIVGFCGC
jgi:Tol biopolymer transport system component